MIKPLLKLIWPFPYLEAESRARRDDNDAKFELVRFLRNLGNNASIAWPEGRAWEETL